MRPCAPSTPPSSSDGNPLALEQKVQCLLVDVHGDPQLLFCSCLAASPGSSPGLYNHVLSKPSSISLISSAHPLPSLCVHAPVSCSVVFSDLFATHTPCTVFCFCVLGVRQILCLIKKCLLFYQYGSTTTHFACLTPESDLCSPVHCTQRVLAPCVVGSGKLHTLF